MTRSWKVAQLNRDGTSGSTVFEKGFKRVEGMDPPTIESLRDVVVEILEGGFLDGDNAVSFVVAEELEGGTN